MDIFDKLTLTMISDQLEMSLDRVETEIVLQKALGKDRTDLILEAIEEAKVLQKHLHSELERVEAEI